MDYAHPEYLAYRPWLIAFGAALACPEPAAGLGPATRRS